MLAGRGGRQVWPPGTLCHSGGVSVLDPPSTSPRKAKRSDDPRTVDGEVKAKNGLRLQSAAATDGSGGVEVAPTPEPDAP